MFSSDVIEQVIGSYNYWYCLLLS